MRNYHKLNWIEIKFERRKKNEIPRKPYSVVLVHCRHTKCFHVIIRVYLLAHLHSVFRVCAFVRRRFGLRETLTLTLCIHCCNKRIENFTIFDFRFHFDAIIRVPPIRTYRVAKKRRQTHDVIGKTHKKSTKRFVFQLTCLCIWNLCIIFMIFICMMFAVCFV